LKLFEEIELGEKSLNNRMVMSAMTRSRANKEGIIGDITVDYYAQRASAGMMLTE
jgi:N-ethylmaleimide reductase